MLNERCGEAEEFSTLITLKRFSPRMASQVLSMVCSANEALPRSVHLDFPPTWIMRCCVTDELLLLNAFPHSLQSQKFSLVPIVCIWIGHSLMRAFSASKDPFEHELSVFQKKNTALADGFFIFTEHSFFLARALSYPKVWEDHQFVATFLTLWSFFPELTEHPISEPFSGRDAGLST